MLRADTSETLARGVDPAGAATPSFWFRVRRFLARSPRAKYLALAFRARRWFPKTPIPLWLGYGAWWLAEESALDEKLIHEGFEAAELKFVEKILHPGMTVLDAGAHHGLYTLLASKRIGRKGKVIAFEPSPRERKRLLRHLRLNWCWNVIVQGCALGDTNGEADLFVVDGFHDWFNSLRRPSVAGQVQTRQVAVRRADDALAELGIRQVDFIKLDVEGAELSFLKGAVRILQSRPRPAILAEVQDIRTRAWGYTASEILEFLSQRGYRWFSISSEGLLRGLPLSKDFYDANFVGLPEERLEDFREFLPK